MPLRLLASQAKGSPPSSLGKLDQWVLVTPLIGGQSLAQPPALGKAVWPIFLLQSPATLWPRRQDGGLLRLPAGVRDPVGAHGLFVSFLFFSFPGLPSLLPSLFFFPLLSFPHLFPSNLAKPGDNCLFSMCWSPGIIASQLPWPSIAPSFISVTQVLLPWLKPKAIWLGICQGGFMR